MADIGKNVLLKDSNGKYMYPVTTIDSVYDEMTGKSFTEDLMEVLKTKQDVIKAGNAIRINADNSVDVIPDDLCGFGLIGDAIGTISVDTEYVPRMYDFNELVKRVETLEEEVKTLKNNSQS